MPRILLAGVLLAFVAIRLPQTARVLLDERTCQFLDLWWQVGGARAIDRDRKSPRRTIRCFSTARNPSSPACSCKATMPQTGKYTR